MKIQIRNSTPEMYKNTSSGLMNYDDNS